MSNAPPVKSWQKAILLIVIMVAFILVAIALSNLLANWMIYGEVTACFSNPEDAKKWNGTYPCPEFKLEPTNPNDNSGN